MFIITVMMLFCYYYRNHLLSQSSCFCSCFVHDAFFDYNYCAVVVVMEVVAGSCFPGARPFRLRNDFALQGEGQDLGACFM